MISVLVRGGGDLASGVVYRLHQAGIQVVITELSQPLVVRRLAAFAQAIYAGVAVVEGVQAQKVETANEAQELASRGIVPVLIDPQAKSRHTIKPLVIIDARMTKQTPELGKESAELVVGLGPGFTAGENCHAVIETNRGHWMGRVIWQGNATPDTGMPEEVARYREERVLRAPADGTLHTLVEIGQSVEEGELVAEVGGDRVVAPFGGVIRGLLYPGIRVTKGIKIGDLDPRNDTKYTTHISDKSLAVGGGVLEAILSRESIRERLWT